MYPLLRFPVVVRIGNRADHRGACRTIPAQGALLVGDEASRHLDESPCRSCRGGTHRPILEPDTLPPQACCCLRRPRICTLPNRCAPSLCTDLLVKMLALHSCDVLHQRIGVARKHTRFDHRDRACAHFESAHMSKPGAYARADDYISE